MLIPNTVRKDIRYIGAAGITEPVQTTKLLMVTPRGAKRRLAIGIFVDSGTLKGSLHVAPTLYPHVDDIPKIPVKMEPRLLTFIHYHHTHHPDALPENLTALTEKFMKTADGIVLSAAWPRIKKLVAYRAMYPEPFLALRIDRAAIDLVHRRAAWLAEKIRFYAPLVNAFILDLGDKIEGPFNAHEAKRWLQTIRQETSMWATRIGIGLAWHFGPETLHHIDPLVAEFPDLNIDRIPRNGTLDFKTVERYVARAFDRLEPESQ